MQRKAYNPYYFSSNYSACNRSLSSEFSPLARYASCLMGAEGKHGYMVTISDLYKPAEDWQVSAVPLMSRAGQP